MPYYVNNGQNTEYQLLYCGNAVFDLRMQGPQEQVGRHGIDLRAAALPRTER